jgi:fructose-1,6-bisphosphatase/inositol monophosphatase family enzyme
MKKKLAQKVIDYSRFFEKSEQSDVLSAMIFAAEEAGEICREWYEMAHAGGSENSDAVLKVEIKYENRRSDGYEDVLTIADRESEAAIIPVLKETLDIPVVSEELGHEIPDSQLENGSRRWLIDPIDGTYCFKNGMPDFSITIALQTKINGIWQTDAALVASPMQREIYVADSEDAYLVQGQRAKKLQSLAADIPAFSGTLNDAFDGKVVETAIFSKTPSVWSNMEEAICNRLPDSTQRTFSTAIMLAKIADNWVDGAILGADALEYPWDTDAALHIAKMAGAKIRTKAIDGVPCVMVANSHSLLRALDHVAVQEHAKLRGAALTRVAV